MSFIFILSTANSSHKSGMYISNLTYIIILVCLHSAYASHYYSSDIRDFQDECTGTCNSDRCLEHRSWAGFGCASNKYTKVDGKCKGCYSCPTITNSESQQRADSLYTLTDWRGTFHPVDSGDVDMCKYQCNSNRYYDHVNNNCRQCSGCTGEAYISSECTAETVITYTPSTKTYSSVLGKDTACATCSTCAEGTEHYSGCSGTSDRRCQCSTGYYRTDGNLNLSPGTTCNKCNTCYASYGLTTQSTCTKTSDVVCKCSTGYYRTDGNTNLGPSNNCNNCHTCSSDNGLTTQTDCTGTSDIVCKCLTGYYGIFPNNQSNVKYTGLNHDDVCTECEQCGANSYLHYGCGKDGIHDVPICKCYFDSVRGYYYHEDTGGEGFTGDCTACGTCEFANGLMEVTACTGTANAVCQCYQQPNSNIVSHWRAVSHTGLTPTDQCQACGTCTGTTVKKEHCTHTSDTVCQCIQGHYFPEVGESGFSPGTTCSPCGECTNNGVETASQCTLSSNVVCRCRAGFYRTSNADSFGPSGVCGECDDGKISSAGSKSCTACTQGTYANAAHTTCISCEEGKYSNSDGASQCSQCPEGTYSNTVGSISCTACAAGKVSINTGSTSCTACPAGQIPNSGKTGCVPCGVGTYSASEGATACTSCSDGTVSTIEGATECTPCSAGTYSNSAHTECQPCDPGWVSEPGESTCTQCPPNTKEVNHISCSRCDTTNGYQAPAGSTTCELCATGSFLDMSQDPPVCKECENCDATTQQSQEGACISTSNVVCECKPGYVYVSEA